MNDIKKLIQMLKEYQKPYIGHDYIFYGIEFCNPQVQMCIEALEKQVPKVPTRQKFGAWEIYNGLCINCLTPIRADMNYCPECGQKLDWEGRK